MKPTDIKDQEYFHKVVDCQYACPAHTPVPEYIRLIAQQRYTDAYMINWESNVFPGVLGRTCDRPCEPACRRGRVESEPVAICRLKRVAADFKDDIKSRLPTIPAQNNGKKIALIGAGPASLTVARDLAPLGYTLDVYDEQSKAGGFMRSQIPSFRLPETVLDEEVGYILGMGLVTHFNHYVDSLKELIGQNYDAIFVGSGAPRGRDLPTLPGRQEGDKSIHVGIDWLASVAFEHVEKIGKRVIVLGGGNTAMDCCRTARRLGGDEVKVIVRSPFEEMKASTWEKEDAIHEGIPIIENHVPLEFVHEGGKLVGMRFEKVSATYDDSGKRSLVPTGDGGDSAFGPTNIITAVAHGHQAAVSIDLFCEGKQVDQRPPPGSSLISQKMGIHEWSYDNDVTTDLRKIVPLVELTSALQNRKLEVELGFDLKTAFAEAERCLNCDVQTVFFDDKCIECDACVDICPMDCINFIGNSEETELRQQLRVKARNEDQDLYVSGDLNTGRVMVKDEDVCLHCGLCAERCPTAAWDMQQFYYQVTKAAPLFK